MKKISLLAFLVVLFSFSHFAGAQFQSCTYCDVEAFVPDPFHVDPCDSGVIIVRGAGFQEPAVNGCDAVPVVDVRSTRPDRVQIVSFQVLSDTEIEVRYSVPCAAPEGIVGFDVRIDDIAGDGIDPYACGNARLYVDPVELSVDLLYFKAFRGRQGVRVEWATGGETDTMGFKLYRGSGGAAPMVSVGPELIPSRGQSGGADYFVLDPVPPVPTASLSYILVEVSTEGMQVYGPVTVLAGPGINRDR